MTKRRGRRAMLGGTATVLGLLASCGDPSVTPADNPVPLLESLVPPLVQRSSSPVTIEVRGLGFVESAEARWNGDARASSYVDGTRLQVALSPEDLLAASGQIDVVNPAPGGGASNVLELLIGNAVPTLSRISPTEATAGSLSALEIQAVGSDFLAGAASSVLLWDAIPLATEVTSDTTLTATVPDYLLRVGHTAALAVANPAPGGGVSNVLPFDVENPVPSVTGTDPGGVPANADSDLTVRGSGFVHGATVWIDGTSLAPTELSDTLLTVRVPGSATGGIAGSAVLRVINPGPGGGASSDFDLTIWLFPPRIDALDPPLLFSGADDVELQITGTQFDPGATVLVNGAARAATVVDASLIEVTIPAADVASAGTLEIRVVNPFDAGEASKDITVAASSAASILLAERGEELALLGPTGAELDVIPTPLGADRVDASPTSNHVLYHSGRIFEMDLAVGVPRRVSTAPADGLWEEQWARYSSDGVWVYFMGDAGWSKWELWRTPRSGATSERLLALPNESVGYPSPSHAGDRVVYARGVSEGSSAALTILDLNTSTSTPLGVQGATSRWTPDDEWIVYWTWNRTLRAVRPDGSGDFALTSGIQVASGFDISPQGDLIVAAREDGSGAVLIAFPSGAVYPLPGSGRVESTAWFGP